MNKPLCSSCVCMHAQSLQSLQSYQNVCDLDLELKDTDIVSYIFNNLDNFDLFAVALHFNFKKVIFKCLKIPHVLSNYSAVLAEVQGMHLLSLGHVQLFASQVLQPARLLCPWDSLGKNTGMVAMPFSRRSSQPRD